MCSASHFFILMLSPIVVISETEHTQVGRCPSSLLSINASISSFEPFINIFNVQHPPKFRTVSYVIKRTGFRLPRLIERIMPRGSCRFAFTMHKMDTPHC
jgi:hypothetical protein